MPAAVERCGQQLGGVERCVVLAGRDDVHVSGRHRTRPAQPLLVVRLLGERGDRPGDSDAVGAHRDRDRLAVRAERLEPEGLGVLAAELEDVAQFDAARDLQRAAAPHAAVAVADLDGTDLAVRFEVSSAHDERGMLATGVRPGDPGTAVDHERVDEVPDVEAARLAEDLRSDVALHELRHPGEVGGLGLGHLDRFELTAEPLEVHLTVTGHAHDEQLPVLLARRAGAQHDVLQRVGRGERLPEIELVQPGDERVDRRRIGRIENLLVGEAAGLDGRRPGDLDRLGVRGIVAVRALDEAVLADRRGGEELLGGRTAHRAGHGEDDAVVETEPREDPLVGVAMRSIGRREPFVGQVEGVRVLHDELAAAQDSGARAGLVAVLRLNLEQRERVVLVRGVLALDQQGEQLLVRRTRAGSRRLCGPAAGTGCRRSRPTGR